MTLKDLIKQKGIKQVQLAKRIGVKVSSLNLQINGWQDLPDLHLKKLCKELGINFKNFNSKKVEVIKND